MADRALDVVEGLPPAPDRRSPAPVDRATRQRGETLRRTVRHGAHRIRGFEGFGTRDPGTYTSEQFQPPITLEVPEGWEVEFDEPGVIEVWTEDPIPGGVYVVRDPVALRPDPQVEADAPEAASGVGGSAEELVEWLTGHPELDTTEPAPVTIAGVDATRVDVRMAADSTSSPFWCEVEPCADVLGRTPDDPDFWVFLLNGPDKTMTVILLTAPDGAVRWRSW